MIDKTDVPFNAIVGVPYAALPYATVGFCVLLRIYLSPLHFCTLQLVAQSSAKPLMIIRKEAKSYGTKKLIEGLYSRGDKVVIIEDVVTTGGSIQDVVNVLRDEELVVEHVFCLLDREQGGAEKLKEHGITLHW
ncbi:unnamed protein product [Strongylus vulgaris]|uniref:Phosphoribosyltransferase domain-containing protein n=1 Tax=Strongylus vulgaris TaxID=40348 RepID=A0A3P7J3B2_STRVU|nr:unnamed protein product [Strongylus vulgaris]